MTGGVAPPGYDPDDHPRVAVTVDVVVLTVRDGVLHVVLVERGDDPWAGAWALPGGFVRPDEDLEAAAARELAEETGVDAAAHLEQIRAYGDPDRDPRMRIVTVAFLAVLRDVGPLEAGTDAVGAELVPVAEVLGRRPKRRLAFDHRQILADAVEHAGRELESTSLAAAFVGPTFTLSQLRQVYEAVWETPLDPGNFRRKVLANEDAFEATDERIVPSAEGGKPASLYRSRDVRQLSSPVRRPSWDQPSGPSKRRRS